MKKKLGFWVLTLLIFILVSATALALTSVQIAIDGDTSVEYGKEDVVTGILWPAGLAYNGENGVNDQTLSLQSRTKGTTTWNDEIDVTTEALTENGVTYNGVVVAGGKLDASTQFKWVYDGDATYAAAESSIFTTIVNAKISLKAVKNAAKGVLTLKGTVAPTHRGKKVTIKAKKQGGGWSTLAVVKTDANSNFKHNFNMKGKSGIYSFVAYFVADTDHGQGKSKTVKSRI